MTLPQDKWTCQHCPIGINRPGTENLSMKPYLGDDYDRKNCAAVIEPNEYGYRMAIFSPSGMPMECYTGKSPRAISRMILEWTEGRQVRRSVPGDQDYSESVT